MARYWFGDRPADFVVAPGAQADITTTQIGYEAILYPSARLWAYDYDTGERVTDLLDDTGAAVTEITSTSYGRVPRFRGPDGVQVLLLGQAEDYFDGTDDPPDLDKWVLTSIEWPSIVAGIESRVSTLESGGVDVVATAHPLIWSLPGAVEDHTSAHRYVNLEGTSQTIETVRASATVTSGTLTVRVLTVDMDTSVSTVATTITLDTTTQAALDTTDVTVTDGTGVTVQVELSDPADDVADVTVQVMIR
ncbi:hypothetical protein [Nocardiopsis sp. FR26]|uniref:hypothetical protein n=1 Tax=Nocardiopsis sp. FR26 TaxID=2605987 RepID=UPI001357A6F4|nr:hypothetical protein [Nocardiopsis sp. FR26]